MGAESTSLCTWGKHLPNLLRNKAKSQKHPRVNEFRRPKSTEDTEKTDGKGIASGQKGHWNQHTDQGGCSPRPVPAGPAEGLLEESLVKDSFPCQRRLGQNQERPGCLKSQGGD